MSKLMSVAVVMSAVLFVGSLSLIAGGTKADAETMVKKAIAFAKENGKEKACAEISKTDGQFVKDDIYVVVYDMNGKCLAHGANPKLVGKELMGMKDPDGVEYVKVRVEMMKTKDSGWQDYKFTNPTTKALEPKTMYIEKFDGVIFGSGAYKQ